MRVLHYTLFSFAVLLISCSSQKQHKGNLGIEITKFMEGEYKSVNNDNDSLMLTWNTRDNNSIPVLKYAVWNLKTGERIYSGTAIRGKVSWLSDSELELYDYPGIIDDDNPLYRYKIDLNTKTKTALREENKL